MSLLNDYEHLNEFNDLMNVEEADLPEPDDENLFGEPTDADNNDEKAENNILSAKKRTVRNPRPRLTAELLCGDRGIHNIEDYFKNIRFKGKGKEAEDLDEVMRRLQHWAHRLYPAFKFDDALTAIERLGKKRQVQVHMSRYRLGLLEKPLESEEIPNNQNNFDNAEINENVVTEEPFDEFDALLDQQISISRLETVTPNQKAHHNYNQNNKYTTPINKSYATKIMHSGNNNLSTVRTNMTSISTPSQSTKISLSVEQKAKMDENRRLAMERLKAKKLLEEQQKQQEKELQPIDEDIV